MIGLLNFLITGCNLSNFLHKTYIGLPVIGTFQLVEIDLKKSGMLATQFRNLNWDLRGVEEIGTGPVRHNKE
jgi:hypothetical protein